MALITWAVIAFIAAIFAGAVGFSGITRRPVIPARILFGILLIIALILLVLAITRML